LTQQNKSNKSEQTTYSEKISISLNHCAEKDFEVSIRPDKT